MASAAPALNYEELKPYTDCRHFMEGGCKFKEKCSYRHCEKALGETRRCRNWPKLCRKLECVFRHPNRSKTQNDNAKKAEKDIKETESTSSRIQVSNTSHEKPICILWDIENVQIPRGQKPFDIVQRIRTLFVNHHGLKEESFTCYCNINTLPKEHQVNLSHANVRIVHVPDPKPGAVDRQIMLELDRFERSHRPPATVVLISGDIDFVGKLDDLRHKAGFDVIVIHNKSAKEELKRTVNANYSWQHFIRDAKADTNESDSDSDTNGFGSSKRIQVQRSMACAKCGEKFPSKTALNEHQISLNHVFVCSECDRSFFTPKGHFEHEKGCKGAKRVPMQKERSFKSSSRVTDVQPPMVLPPKRVDVVEKTLSDIILFGIRRFYNDNIQ